MIGNIDTSTIITASQTDLLINLVAALIIGSIIGMERTYSGRPAGFRTHALVCVSSALLMLMTAYQDQWLAHIPAESVRTDPTRMAQGIMTGIGFLGAGVIFKEGLTVRGLTTAASIWMTAAIGALLGIGFYMPAIAASVITVGVLSLFRSVEGALPSRHFAEYLVQFRRELIMPEAEFRSLLAQHKCSVLKVGYALKEEGRTFEYNAMIRTLDKDEFAVLAQSLLAHPMVKTFSIRIRAN